METIPLDPVDAVTVTTLVDNVADLLLADQGPVTRSPITPATEPMIPARFLEGGRTGDALRAEHGFSCLVTITKGEQTTRVLFDAGLTPDGLIENMRRLEISPERRRLHLSGPIFEPIIPPTCDALEALAPAHLVPCHCTAGSPSTRSSPGSPTRSSRTRSARSSSSAERRDQLVVPDLLRRLAVQ